jgi:nucleoside-diphosphate-sugar epimerase
MARSAASQDGGRHAEAVRVVVTGASGTIGTALLRWLVDHPVVDSVVGVARHGPPGAANPQRVGWRRADIAEPDAAQRLSEIFAGADAVVHLAWRITADHDREHQRRTNREGSAAVLEAVRRTGVRHLTFLSSAAVYSPAPAGAVVGEDWPRRGIPGSPYSADKVVVEDMLDRAGTDTPDLRVARIRPPLVLATSTAHQATGMALGRLAPLVRLTGGWVPLVLMPSRTRVQLVAAADVAELVGRALLAGAHGAYNVADSPVLTPAELARLLGGRHVPAPAAVARSLLDLTFRARLQQLDHSWFDVLLRIPVLDCARARDELGWRGDQDARTLLTRMRQALAAPPSRT